MYRLPCAKGAGSAQAESEGLPLLRLFTTPPSWLRRATTPGSAVQPPTGEAFMKVCCAAPTKGRLKIEVPLVQRGKSTKLTGGLFRFTTPPSFASQNPPPLHKEGEAFIKVCCAAPHKGGLSLLRGGWRSFRPPMRSISRDWGMVSQKSLTNIYTKPKRAFFVPLCTSPNPNCSQILP